MPRYKVTAPDGSTHYVNAPEGASQDQALDYFRQNYKAPAAQQEPSAVRDFGKAALHHLGNLPLGIAQLGANAIGQGDGMNQWMDDRENQYQAEVGDTPAAYAGAAVGEILPMLTGIGAAGKVASVVGRGASKVPVLGKTAQKVIGRTGEGAVLGASMPVTNSDDYWGTKGVQTAAAGALQPVGNAIASGAGKLVNGVMDRVRPSPDAAALQQRLGINAPWWKATEGGLRNFAESAKSMPMTRAAMVNKEREMFSKYNQTMAGRATPTHLPVMDEAGNVLRWEANKPTGAVGQDFLRQAGQQFDQAYGALYGNRTIPVDDAYNASYKKMVDYINNVTPDVKDQVLGRMRSIHDPMTGATNLQQTHQPAQMVDSLMNKVNPARTTQQGGHVGVSADSIKENIAQAYSHASQLAKEGKHTAADYMRQYANDLEALRMRGLPPEVGPELEGLNKAFGNFAQYRRGMNTKAAQKQGMLTPDQHLNAIMANGKRYGTLNQSATGQLPNQADATLAAKVMDSTIPDSGTGSRVFGMLGMLNPKMLAADWAASRAMTGGGLPRVLTGDTSAQQWLKSHQQVGNATSRALRTLPGLVGHQLGVE